MSKTPPRRFKHLAIAACLTISTLLTGCMSTKTYVDPKLPRVALTDIKPSADKQAVHLQVEFQTNGATNARAREFAQPVVAAMVKDSGLFSDVALTPGTNERRLFVTINNFVVTKDAASKGFVTGLTFGLAGTSVTDGYLMTAIYSTPGKAEVKRTYQHALHTTVGNAEGPAGLKPAKDMESGAREVLEGLTLNLLNDMSKAGEL